MEDRSRDTDAAGYRYPDIGPYGTPDFSAPIRSGSWFRLRGLETLASVKTLTSEEEEIWQHGVGGHGDVRDSATYEVRSAFTGRKSP